MNLIKFVSVFTIGSVLFFSIVYADQLPNKINQEIRGNNNNASIALPGGTVNYNYQTSGEEITSTIKQANNEMLSELSNCFKVAAKLQASIVEELGDELSRILLKNNKITHVEAEGWAKSIIDNSQDIKDAQKQVEETLKRYNEETTRMLISNIYSYMTYILSYIDENIRSLQKVDDKIDFKKNSKFVLFDNDSKLEKPYPIRSIFLPGENSVQIICHPGRIHNGLTGTLPSLTFNEIKHDKVVQQFKFKAAPPKGAVLLSTQLPYNLKKNQYEVVRYPWSGGPDLDEKTKKQFSETFTKFFQLAYATQ